jgi:hypothetical protein
MEFSNPHRCHTGNYSNYPESSIVGDAIFQQLSGCGRWPKERGISGAILLIAAHASTWIIDL